MCKPIINDSPNRIKLKRTVSTLINKNLLKTKKIKLLNQKVRRQCKKIASMKLVINSLKKNNLVNYDTSELLSDMFGKHKDMLCRFVKKNQGKKLKKMYNPEIRRFAITLHFYSAKAYNYVREEFITVLPHPRTLGKWYACTNADPGFTSETLKILSLKCKNSNHPIYCCLIIDEMAIRHHIEWDGKRYHGYVDFGANIDSEKSSIASESFVFMLMCLNERWKIPVGYFLVNHLNSSQKHELINQCLSLLFKTGVKVISFTFDGCSSNINMARQLGCNLNIKSLKSNFEHKLDNNSIENIAIFPDPAHMIKLVRNTFGEKKIL